MAIARSKPAPPLRRSRQKGRKGRPNVIPEEGTGAEIHVDGHPLHLTHLDKPFWPEDGITKRGLLRYYATVSTHLIPHLKDRAMVLKRYPNGAAGEFFFQKRAPAQRPDWIELCVIEHAAAGKVPFVIVRDLASLLWTVNLGCIDLNPWYGRCDDPNRPDYLHFDLDPVEGAGFEEVCETAFLVHQALEALEIPNYAKTTGSRGIHICVPILRGPAQKEVWTFAKRLAQSVEQVRPDLVTSEYRVTKRPKGHVLVDYNQNAWGRTLASVYSVRPKPHAPVSTPVTWDEIKRGIRIEDFRIDNVPDRLSERGDLWKPLLQKRGRFELRKLL